MARPTEQPPAADGESLQWCEKDMLKLIITSGRSGSALKQETSSTASRKENICSRKHDTHLYHKPLSTPDKSKEDQVLAEFSLRYRNARDFSGDHADLKRKVFLSLVERRLCCGECVGGRAPPSLLRVVRCVRLMMRDAIYLSSFAETGGAARLLPVLEKVTAGCHGDSVCLGDPCGAELVKEAASVCQKLTAVQGQRRALVDAKVHRHLVLLLATRDVSVLHSVLRALISIAEDAACAAALAGINVTESLLKILQAYDLFSKRLASQLLRLISCQPVGREDVKLYRGLPTLLSLLHSGSVELVWNTVWTLVNLVQDADLSNEIRLQGGIPIFLSLLQDGFPGDEDVLPCLTESPGSSSAVAAAMSSVTTKQEERKRAYVLSLRAGCCAVLTELMLDDGNSQSIVDHGNAIYAVAWLLLPETPRTTQEKHWENLQKNAFRALRFMFSMERNRRQFRRLFPPELFAAFIDVGHYVRELSAYAPLVARVNACSPEEVATLAAHVRAADENKRPSFHIRQYAVYELLGSGAFGSVYKVKKSGASEGFLALKQINVDNPVFGKQEQGRDDTLANEMGVIQEKLKHPNVVKYHKVFSDRNQLFILMELIEGAPLAEHFSSLKEKAQRFSEERIWNIFTQMVLALRYLHKEKGIVHRDLTPNNIMLGANDKVTITDFGLAKHAHKEMTSIVGTITYASPEIVQNLPYNEKVDVWAAGAVLYEMCRLTPAFYSTNMLSLAIKIVEGSFEPIPADQYSETVTKVVARCLTVKNEERADIIQVSSLMSEKLLAYIDGLRVSHAALERRLERERQRNQQRVLEANRLTLNYQTLLQAAGVRDAGGGGMCVSEEEGGAGEKPCGRSTSSPVLADSGVFVSGRLLKQGGDGRDTRSRGSSSKEEPAGEMEEEEEGGDRVERHPARKESKSASTPCHHGNAGLDLARTTPEKARPRSANMVGCPTLSISSKKVRQINDPTQEILHLLHKIIFITQLPPSLKRSPRRHLVECFKQKLFAQKLGSTNIKTELSKIISGSEELVDFGTLEPHYVINKPSVLSNEEPCPGVTYRHLQSVVESVLVENGYYDVQQIQKISSMVQMHQRAALPSRAKVDEPPSEGKVSIKGHKMALSGKAVSSAGVKPCALRLLQPRPLWPVGSETEERLANSVQHH